MTIHDLGRTPSTIGHVDKRLPELPKPVSKTSNEDDGSVPSDTVSQCGGGRSVPSLRVRIPQFRQSKGWARSHGFAEQPHPLANPPQDRDSYLDTYTTPEDIRGQLLSKREVSFEQQRAVQKQPLFQRHSPVGGPELPCKNRSVSDGSLGSLHGCSARINTAECWRFVRPTVSRLPRANTTGWPRRGSKGMKMTPSRRREFASRRSSVTLCLPSAENNNHVQKRNSAGSNRVTSDFSHQRSLSALKKRSYRQSEGCSRRNLAASLIPSTHGPLKGGTLMDEWRETMKLFDSDNESSLPVVSTSITDMEGTAANPILLSKTLYSTEETAPNRVSFVRQSRHQLSKEGTGGGGGSIISGHVPSSATLQTPVAPAQQLSMVTSKRASILQAGQNQPSTIAPAGVVRGVDQNQDREATTMSLHNVRPHSMMRLPSGKSVMSTDTMVDIEAQVQYERTWLDLGPLGEVIQKLTSNTVCRQSGPPPSIPLPALPPRAQDEQSEVSRSSEDSEGMCSSRRNSSANPDEFVRRLIQGPRADKVRAQRLRDLKQSPNQSPKPESQAEAKQNVPRSTAEGDVKFPATVNTFLEDLGRFPAVPDSRPTSAGNISVRSTYIRQHSPGKNSVHGLDRTSKISSVGDALQSQRHVLSQSNIFVVVDSDPVTARFRASVGGSSPERRSPARLTKPATRKEFVVHQTCPAGTFDSKTAVQDPHEQQAQTLQPPAADNKRPATSDSRHQSSSSDEPSLGSIGTDSLAQKPARNRKRRRWNSNDIRIVKLLQQDLEEYYAKIREQEEKIKRQAHQIQMMNKGLATSMSQLQGVKASAQLQGSPPDLSAIVSGVQPSHSPQRRSGPGPKERRQRNLGARSPLSIIKEQTLNTHPQVGLSFIDDASSTAITSSEALNGSLEVAVTRGGREKFPILGEPISLTRNKSNASGSRYYRP